MPRKLARYLLGVLLAFVSGPGLSEPRFQGHASHGMPGLLETPWAYTPEEGTLSLSLSSHLPYVTLGTSAQVLPWFWFGARYTQVRDRPYNPGTTNGTPYLDKGFDVVFSPLREGHFQPALSIGLLDIAGTGIFSSEYIVASKSFSMFTASLGLGWGRFGSAADIENPLGLISTRFSDERDVFNEENDQGGALFSGNWFSGPNTSILGSFVWHSPAKRWQAFVEYDGNIYDNNNDNLQRDNEAASKRVASNSRWNAGIRWRPSRGMEITAGYIRGNTATVSLRLFSNLSGSPTDRYEPALHTRVRPQTADGEESAWIEQLWQNRIWIRKFSQSSDNRFALIDTSYGRSDAHLVDSHSVARLALTQFPELDRVQIREFQLGMPLLQSDWLRQPVEGELTGEISREELYASATVKQAPACEVCPDIPVLQSSGYLEYPSFAYTFSPSLRSNIGSEGGFVLTDLQLKPGARVQIADHLSLSAILAIRVGGTLDDAESSDSSQLPHVRSDLERYQSESRLIYLESLELDYYRKLSKQVYAKATVGIFEDMFGGAFSELLWVHKDRNLALGAELAWAKQRGYRQGVTFRPYSVVTGHLNLFWNTGWQGIKLHLSAGRYLARDVGATFRLSRAFPSGLEVGAFATKTNVSAAKFGEGSFDKGFFFKIPLHMFKRGNKGDMAKFDYRFLTRDGGQKLNVNRRLVDELDFPGLN